MDTLRELNGNTGTLRRFEARIFNAWVRVMLDAGEDNVTGFDDAWSEGRLVEVWTLSMTDAIARFEQEYPVHVGFKISGVREVHDQ